MTEELRASGQSLRAAQARVLGAIEAARSDVNSVRDEAYRVADRTYDRSRAMARNRSAEAVIGNTLRVRDRAADLQIATVLSLRAAEYVTVGRLIAPGNPAGINEDIDVPLVLPLVGRGNIILDSSSKTTKHVLEQIVWQALQGTGPGQLDILGYDPKLTSFLAPFSGLRRVSDDNFQLITRPDDLDKWLNHLVSDVQRVAETLRGTTSTLVEFRREVGYPIERFQLVVLIDYPEGIDENTHRKVITLAKAGPDAGVSFVIAPLSVTERPDWWRDDDLASVGATLHETGGALRWTAHDAFTAVAADEKPEVIVRGVEAVVDSAMSLAGTRLTFERIQPTSTTWGCRSADRLQFAVGLSGAKVAEIALGDERDQRHNILITGAVGQGKSNLLMVIIHSLAQRYSPEELALYLLDFKEGVTFYPLASTPDAPDFLPHVRVLGLESDREFGLTVLRHIEGEFARRARLFRPYGDSISRYRAAVPDAVMPRIVVVVDEFHMLFDPNDRIAEEAARLLEAIARRGRSYGVHLLLASQTISGVSALMAREGGIFAQFPIRLALKNAAQESYATLGQGNDAAARLRMRGEAILNLDYGHIDSNRKVIIAAADDAELSQLRLGWWEASKAHTDAPLVFDGSHRRRIADALDELRVLRAGVADGRAPLAVLGYPIDVSGRPLSISLGAEPGRNLAILGAGEATTAVENGEMGNIAVGVLQSAAISLALQHPSGDAEFVCLEMLDEGTLRHSDHRVWLDTMASIGYSVKRVGRDDIVDYLLRLVATLDGRDSEAPPLYIFGFGMDRATALETSDLFGHRASEDLQQVLRSGPPKRIHMLGWWANGATFKSHIGFGGEGFIDAMLMLRVDQSTVQELLSSPFITWSVRDNRGLLSDRTQMAEPTLIVPFSPVTVQDATILGQAEWQVDSD